MQASLKIKPSAALSNALIQDTDSKNELLTADIHAHSEQIAYMLQTYYSREKVSDVNVIPGTIEFDGLAAVFKIDYVMEEFNACSAVDTVNKEKMTVKADFDTKGEVLNLTGEYWPERDAE